MEGQIRILIFAYYSYNDPVFQGAVLPYFTNFPDKNKFQFILLTFEHDQYPMTEHQIIQISDELARHQIIWERTKWRSGSFKFIKKLMDFGSACLHTIRLIRKYKVSAVYSEGYPGAILGYYMSKLAHRHHYIHSIEPHADYMVEAGVWKESSWETIVFKFHEKKVPRHASLIFTATEGMINRMANWGVDRKKIFRVPSCIDMVHFSFDGEARETHRRELGIASSETVLVYLGKFGGMYMEEEAFDFFRTIQETLSAFILIISPDDPGKIRMMSNKAGVNPARVHILSLTRKDIPGWLSVADIGFVGVRQKPSKKFCSPIKTGEYLACGLSLIIPQGISDDWKTLSDAGLAAILKAPEKSGYLEVINEWSNRIKANDPTQIRAKARKYAELDRSIEPYKKLYHDLFANS